jgi:hypothetical protein
MSDEQKAGGDEQLTGGATAGGDIVGGDKRTIQTAGGAYSEGTISTGDDFVGRDQIIYNYQLDIEKLVEVLREALPEDDPTPQRLRQTLQGFQHYHHQLYEWKELHNCLNDILFVLDQFLREVDRLDISGQPARPRDLLRGWRPIAQKVAVLLEWAATIQYIGPEPYTTLPDGSLRGPKWAVELRIAQNRLDDLLEGEALDTSALYDAAYDFNDTADRHMFLADKQLRNTAAELYNLSRVVLGGVDQ